MRLEIAFALILAIGPLISIEGRLGGNNNNRILQRPRRPRNREGGTVSTRDRVRNRNRDSARARANGLTPGGLTDTTTPAAPEDTQGGDDTASIPNLAPQLPQGAPEAPKVEDTTPVDPVPPTNAAPPAPVPEDPEDSLDGIDISEPDEEPEIPEPEPEIPAPEAPPQQDPNDVVDSPTNVDGDESRSGGDGEADAAIEISQEGPPQVQEPDPNDVVDSPSNVDGDVPRTGSVGDPEEPAMEISPEIPPAQVDPTDVVDSPSNVDGDPAPRSANLPTLDWLGRSIGGDAEEEDAPVVIGDGGYQAFVCGTFQQQAKDRCSSLPICKYKTIMEDGTRIITSELVPDQGNCVRRCDGKFGLSANHCDIHKGETCQAWITHCRCNSLSTDGGECQPF